MKKSIKGMLFLFICLAVLPSYLSAYDNSPSDNIIVPEVIWAAASGGGTWITSLQITDLTTSSVVSAYFHYGTSYRYVANIWTSPGFFRSRKFDNILQFLGTIDTGFSYYGRVGTLWLFTQGSDHKIQVLARTVNGNYGKTFPGLTYSDSNSANLGRCMVIQDLRFNATYRTFVGAFNATSGGYALTVEFRIVDGDNHLVGSIFYKTFQPWEFKSFNPFKEAGITSGSYENCWLYINVTSSGNSGPGSCGLICYGATTNNFTNDPSAHIAVQFE